MATLNKTEKLIRNAATGNNPFEAKVFNYLLEFYEALDYSINDNMHRKLIIYLYSGNHKGETFDNIARSFNRSVSTLEDNRRESQKMFLYFHKKLEQQKFSAA